MIFSLSYFCLLGGVLIFISFSVKIDLSFLNKCCLEQSFVARSLMQASSHNLGV